MKQERSHGPNPRNKYGPRNRWYVYKCHSPFREARLIVWVWSTVLAQKQKSNQPDRLEHYLRRHPHHHVAHRRNDQWPLPPIWLRYVPRSVPIGLEALRQFP